MDPSDESTAGPRVRAAGYEVAEHLLVGRALGATSCLDAVSHESGGAPQGCFPRQPKVALWPARRRPTFAGVGGSGICRSGAQVPGDGLPPGIDQESLCHGLSPRLPSHSS